MWVAVSDFRIIIIEGWENNSVREYDEREGTEK